jgi:CheY-like chemotaxis protein
MVKKRILIVDDEKAMRASMTVALKLDGRDIDVAENGIRAVGFIEKISYDLVITDYSMPEMDGLELSRIIVSKYPDIPVLMVTANESTRDFIGDNKVFFFQKPFDVIELQKKVEEILNGIG